MRLTPNFRYRSFGVHCASLISAIGVATFLSIMTPASPVARAQDVDAKAPPSPIDITARTKDGVELSATYYPSNRGKEAVPVILMHGYKETRNKFDRLAKFLQTEHGHAVLAVDFRGHGGSTQQTRPGGGAVNLDAAKFRPPDFMNMIENDMEAFRKFLVEENDAGKLNLNKLCLVGADMGATVAINWAATDWSVPPIPSGKQGQDVKALVLISPAMVFERIPVTLALKQPDVQRKISVLIIYGERDRRAKRDAESLYKRWLPFHPEPSESEGAEKQELFIYGFDTENQGMKLVDAGIDNMVSQFIEWRLVNQEYPWSQHRTGD